MPKILTLKNLTKEQKAVIELFKTGNFSVHYHDFCVCSVFKDRFDYDFVDAETGEDIPREEVYEPGDDVGYLPEIVQLLVLALGGKSGSA